jgi:cell division protein FtsB
VKSVKKNAFHILLVAEIIAITIWYLFAVSGLQSIQFGSAQIEQLKEEVAALTVGNETLEHELHERSTNPYYKESIARKELQMAYPNETIYLLTKE